MELQLEGRVALLTGSSKGIGEAIAVALAREGAVVVVHGRNHAQTERVMSAIIADGGRAYAVSGDLTREEEAERLVADAERNLGTIGILVNNAGGSGPKNDWRTTAAEGWAATFDKNVLAAVRVSTRILPKMRRAGWGRIINISSGAALLPPATGPDYSAAKAAINAMTASMAKAVAADGITVNAVSPGTIRSDRLERQFRAAADQRGLAAEGAPWKEIEQAVLPLFADVPLGRVGELDELANVVAFLASPLAGYITGANIPVDGGFSSLG